MRNRSIFIATFCCFATLIGCKGKDQPTDAKIVSIEASTNPSSFEINQTISHGNFIVKGVKSDDTRVDINDFTVDELKEDKYTFTSEDLKIGHKEFTVRYLEFPSKIVNVVVTGTIPVTSVTVDKPTLIVGPKDSLKLTATVYPNDASNKNIRWVTDNKYVANVDQEGNVTYPEESINNFCYIEAISEENDQIYARTLVYNSGNKEEEIKHVESISIGEGDIKKKVDGRYDFRETGDLHVKPWDATYPQLMWSSSDEEVATVEDGYVICHNPGETIIKATSFDGHQEATRKIIVEDSPIPVYAINFEFSEYNIGMGKGSQQLKATVLPEEARDKSLTWSSYNPLVATVDENGFVTPISEGETTITATSVSTPTVKGECKVIVCDVIVPVQSVQAESEIHFTKGSELKKSVNAKVFPEEGTDKRIAYKSNNEKVATVNDLGIVEVVGRGNCAITSTSVDNKSAWCTTNIIVDNDVDIPLKTLKLKDTTVDLYSGEGPKDNYIIKTPVGATDEIKVKVTSPREVSVPVCDAKLSAEHDRIIITPNGEAETGTARITVYTGDETSPSIMTGCVVYFTKKKPININNTIRNFGINETEHLEITTDYYSPGDLRFYSTNKKAIIFENERSPLMKIKGYGEAMIIAKDYDPRYLDGCAKFCVSSPLDLFDLTDSGMKKGLLKPSDKFKSSSMLDDVHCPSFYYDQTQARYYNFTSIPSNAFLGLINFRNFYLSENIETIGDCAFKDTFINYLTINKAVKSIGVDAFLNSNVIDVTIYSNSVANLTDNKSHLFDCISVARIPGVTLTDASYLKKNLKFNKDNFDTPILEKFVDTTGIPLGMEAGHYGFVLKNNGVHGDTWNVPNYVYDRDSNNYYPVTKTDAFIKVNDFCHNLKLPSTIEEIGRISNCKGLKSIDLFDCVNLKDNKLYDNNFDYIRGLKSIKLPKNLEIIGENCFYFSDLTSVTLPTTLKKIGSKAFYYNRLSKVEYKGTVAEYQKVILGKDIFLGNSVTVVNCSDGDCPLMH